MLVGLAVCSALLHSSINAAFSVPVAASYSLGLVVRLINVLDE